MIDRILHNGTIYTLDPHKPQATALAIHHGRIVAVGSDDDILPLAGTNTIRDNLGGLPVYPGFTDAHLHWQWTARTLREVDVFEVPSKQLALERVATRVQTAQSNTWITGNGWSQEYWEDKQFPSAHDLDTVAPNHPVCLRAKSGHAAWVNSAALRIAGIDKDTPDPDGGQIGHNADGQPSGILFETAVELVRQHIPAYTLDSTVTDMKQAQEKALAAGLTGFHDFDGPDCLRALQILREQGNLQLHVLKNVNDYWIDYAYGMGLRWGFGDNWIRIGGMKAFADGALGPRTAHMVEAYEGEPENFGMVVKDKEEILELVQRATLSGLPSTIHAIGDMAVHNMLDVFEQTRQLEDEHNISRASRRHRIEHVQIVHPDDINRLAELDIIASMQPIHATSDYEMADAYWGSRSALAYNPRVQLDRGVTVAFGSDSPVDPFDPLKGIYAAVSRRRPDGTPGPDGWYPEARVSVDEALHGWTTGPAYAAGLEDTLGKLSPGYLADLVVLDHDLYAIPAEEILETAVIGTMVEGQWRFGGV